MCIILDSLAVEIIYIFLLRLGASRGDRIVINFELIFWLLALSCMPEVLNGLV